MKVNWKLTFIFHFYFHCHSVSRQANAQGGRERFSVVGWQHSFLQCRGETSLHGVEFGFKPANSFGFEMDLDGESSAEQPELRGTRIAPATTLVVGVALLAQLVVLSGVAIIMGIAVVTMCALLVEILVLTAVATVLERGIVDAEDLGSLMEITATLFITVTTIALASTSGDEGPKKPAIVPGYPVAALKLS